MNVLASGIRAFAYRNKLENTFRNVFLVKISSNMISSLMDYLKDAFVIEEAQRHDVKGRVVLARDVVKSLCDEPGVISMSVFDFLLDENSLAGIWERGATMLGSLLSSSECRGLG